MQAKTLLVLSMDPAPSEELKSANGTSLLLSLGLQLSLFRFHHRQLNSPNELTCLQNLPRVCRWA